MSTSRLWFNAEKANLGSVGTTAAAGNPMSPESIGLHINAGLLKRFLWRPRKVLSSLAELGACTRDVGGSLADVGRSTSCTTADGRRLVVAELPKGKIIGDTLLVATRDDVVIGGLQGLAGSTEPEHHWVVRKRRFRLPRQLPGTALLVASNPGNYYHWLFDSVPRLGLLELSRWRAEEAEWVIVGRSDLRSHSETLDILRIPATKRLACSKWTVLQFDRLIVPDMPSPRAGGSARWVSEFLRSRFLPPMIGEGPERIYVSRRHSRSRRLVNELELEARLQRAGFHMLMAQNLPFIEQVKAFARARVIVAPHGAGLANLVFCDPGAHVVELVHPERRQHVNYRELAWDRGLTYEAIVGASTCAGTCTDDRQAEFAIDIEKTMHTLQASLL